MEKFTLNSYNSILIIGASGGIGRCWLEKIINDSPETTIIATYRSEEKCKELERLKTKSMKIIKLDVKIEADWENLSLHLSEMKQKLDCCLVTTGFLHDSEISPEKSLRAVSSKTMLENFQVNSFPVLFTGKYVTPYLDKKRPSVLVFLSAMVGSIEENAIGGWYSYRASKTALNMFMKSLAIELKRKKYDTCVISIHPGTTATALSEPFSKNVKHRILSPSESVTYMTKVINEVVAAEETGVFKNWDGRKIEW